METAAGLGDGTADVTDVGARVKAARAAEGASTILGAAAGEGNKEGVCTNSGGLSTGVVGTFI